MIYAIIEKYNTQINGDIDLQTNIMELLDGLDSSIENMIYDEENTAMFYIGNTGYTVELDRRSGTNYYSVYILEGYSDVLEMDEKEYDNLEDIYEDIIKGVLNDENTKKCCREGDIEYFL